MSSSVVPLAIAFPISRVISAPVAAPVWAAPPAYAVQVRIWPSLQLETDAGTRQGITEPSQAKSHLKKNRTWGSAHARHSRRGHAPARGTCAAHMQSAHVVCRHLLRRQLHIRAPTDVLVMHCAQCAALSITYIPFAGFLSTMSMTMQALRLPTCRDRGHQSSLCPAPCLCPAGSPGPCPGPGHGPCSARPGEAGCPAAQAGALRHHPTQASAAARPASCGWTASPGTACPQDAPAQRERQLHV